MAVTIKQSRTSTGENDEKLKLWWTTVEEYEMAQPLSKTVCIYHD